MKFLDKQPKDVGENTSTHSVLLVLVALIHPRFHCIERHQHLFSLGQLLWCWPNNPGSFCAALTG